MDVGTGRVDGLGDLPLELVAHVVHYVRPWQSLVTFMQVHPEWLHRMPSMARIVIQRVPRTDYERLLCAGAPLDIAQSVWDAWPIEFQWPLIEAAAAGGRVDVLGWVCAKSVTPMALELNTNIVMYGRKKCVPVSEVAFADALIRAIHSNHTDIVGWLMAHYEYDRTPYLTERFREAVLLMIALDREQLYACYHARPRGADSHKCSCDDGLVRHAIAHRSHRIVEWMHTNRCGPLSQDLKTRLKYAVQECNYEMARTLMALIKPRAAVSPKFIKKQIDDANIIPMVVAHTSGLCRCTPYLVSRVIANVRGTAHTRKVLEWAAGERLWIGERLERIASDTKPVAIAWGPWVANMAIVEDDRELVDWLFARHDARALFTLSVARSAILMHNTHLAILMHHAGYAPFDQWDVIALAIERHVETAQIGFLLDAGARCTTVAFVAALLLIHPDVLRLLYERCGKLDRCRLQEAVGEVGGLDVSGQVLAWLRANVPSICIREAAVDFVSSAEYDKMGWSTPCACPDCASP